MKIKLDPETEKNYPLIAKTMEDAVQGFIQEHQEKIEEKISGFVIKSKGGADWQSDTANFNVETKEVTLFADSIYVNEHMPEQKQIESIKCATISKCTHETGHALDPDIKENMQKLNEKDQEIRSSFEDYNEKKTEELINEASEIWMNLEKTAIRIGETLFDQEKINDLENREYRRIHKTYQMDSRETIESYEILIPKHYSEMKEEFLKAKSVHISEDEFSVYTNIHFAEERAAEFEGVLKETREETKKYGNVRFTHDNTPNLNMETVKKHKISLFAIDGGVAVITNGKEGMKEEFYMDMNEAKEKMLSENKEHQKRLIEKNPEHAYHLAKTVEDKKEVAEYKLHAVEYHKKMKSETKTIAVQSKTNSKTKGL